MTVLEALAILEAAVVECKKRNVHTPEVRAALDFLEPHIQPEWLIPQFCHHALKERTDNFLSVRVNSWCFAEAFDGIRDGVKELVGRKMDELAREFARTYDMKVNCTLAHRLEVWAPLAALSMGFLALIAPENRPQNKNLLCFQ